MTGRFQRAAAVCGILLALWASVWTVQDRNREPSGIVSGFPASPVPVTIEAPSLTAALMDNREDAALMLCVGCYDAEGKLLSLDITADIRLDRETGDAILPVPSVPDGASKMKVFLLDGELRPLAQVTEADFP